MLRQATLERLRAANQAKREAVKEYEAARRAVRAEIEASHTTEPGPLDVEQKTRVIQPISLEAVEKLLGKVAADTLRLSLRKQVVEYVVLVHQDTRKPVFTGGERDV